MNVEKVNLAKLLTFAGAMPFLMLTVLGFWIENISGFDIDDLLLTYGAIIVSFIAGIHWGVFLFRGTSINLFMHSNVIALLAWVAVVLPPMWGKVLLMICLVYLVLIDWRLFADSIIDEWYLRMRAQITSIVLLTLLLSLIA